MSMKAATKVIASWGSKATSKLPWVLDAAIVWNMSDFKKQNSGAQKKKNAQIDGTVQSAAFDFRWR